MPSENQELMFLGEPVIPLVVEIQPDSNHLTVTKEVVQPYQVDLPFIGGNYNLEAGVAEQDAEKGTIVWRPDPDALIQLQYATSGTVEVLLKPARAGAVVVSQRHELAGRKVLVLTPIYLAEGYTGPLQLGVTIYLLPKEGKD